MVCPKFSAQWNREFFDAYQGIYGQQKRENREFLIEKYFIAALNVIVEPVAWHVISRRLDPIHKMSTSLPIADELAHNIKGRDVPIPEVTLALGPIPIKREV